MVNWSCPTISSSSLFAVYLTTALTSCASKTNDAYDDMMRGTISYPFADETARIGTNGVGEKFVIRTISQGTEYIIEIPRAATDYDVEVPLAKIDQKSAGPSGKIKNVQITDRELVGNMPRLKKGTQKNSKLLDKAFRVGQSDGPKQSPSYTLGLSEVNKFYKGHKKELALIKINNLLSYYPNSVKLYKMKGTILIKMGNYRLAERAWMRAQELSPNDRVLKKGLEKLRERRNKNQSIQKASDQK